jgi:hypothetical protein
MQTPTDYRINHPFVVSSTKAPFREDQTGPKTWIKLTYCLLVRYSFILSRRNGVFLGVWAEIQIHTRVNKFLFKEWIFLRKVSIHFLACSKGVKYKQISNKQAVLFLTWFLHSVIDFD